MITGIAAGSIVREQGNRGLGKQGAGIVTTDGAERRSVARASGETLPRQETKSARKLRQSRTCYRCSLSGLAGFASQHSVAPGEGPISVFKGGARSFSAKALVKGALASKLANTPLAGVRLPFQTWRKVSKSFFTEIDLRKGLPNPRFLDRKPFPAVLVLASGSDPSFFNLHSIHPCTTC